MMRSLFAGVSGLRNHQVRMDVIGNNIANVNTLGYKASRVTFEEAYAQLVQGASRPQTRVGDAYGGVNPMQIGLGMNVSSIDVLFTQGSLETTGVVTDLAIQGDSFFVVSDGERNYFTRSGNFIFDATGRLVSSATGYNVQGRMAGPDGTFIDGITDIVLPLDRRAPARATTYARIGGNLNAAATPGSSAETTITVYDEQGEKTDLKLTFTAVSDDVWDVQIEADGTSSTVQITFDGDGRLASVDGDASSGEFAFVLAGGRTITLDFGTIGGTDGITQFSGSTTALLREQDGYPYGELESIAIDPRGVITGSFSNGVTLDLAQIALADFSNPTGLLRTGDNLYSVSANSGEPLIGFAGEGVQSAVASGALEMSNVDLATEFTNMIIAQRGFQSNARVISTSDEMLQELVNLKR